MLPLPLQVKWGQDKTGDSTKRSLAKAVLWRVFAASNTLICGVFLAKDLSVASKIAGTDTLFKTVSASLVGREARKRDEIEGGSRGFSWLSCFLKLFASGGEGHRGGWD